MTIYGYARVSSQRNEDPNSLKAQTKALQNAGATQIFSECFTGMARSRPEFDKLLNLVDVGDTLIVTKLDRFARSTIHGVEVINALIDKKVTVNVLNMGIMDNTPTGKMVRTVLFAFAEFERDLIMERTAEGKAIARQDPNYREGRPRIEIPELAFISYQARIEDPEDAMTVSQACRELEISRASWYNLLKP